MGFSCCDYQTAVRVIGCRSRQAAGPDLAQAGSGQYGTGGPDVRTGQTYGLTGTQGRSQEGTPAAGSRYAPTAGGAARDPYESAGLSPPGGLDEVPPPGYAPPPGDFAGYGGLTGGTGTTAEKVAEGYGQRTTHRSVYGAGSDGSTY